MTDTGLYLTQEVLPAGNWQSLRKRLSLLAENGIDLRVLSASHAAQLPSCWWADARTNYSIFPIRNFPSSAAQWGLSGLSWSMFHPPPSAVLLQGLVKHHSNMKEIEDSWRLIYPYSPSVSELLLPLHRSTTHLVRSAPHCDKALCHTTPCLNQPFLEPPYLQNKQSISEFTQAAAELYRHWTLER